MEVGSGICKGFAETLVKAGAEADAILGLHGNMLLNTKREIESRVR